MYVCPIAANLHECMTGTDAAVAETIAACRAQTEITIDQGIHDAVLAPDLVFLAPIPVDLGVHVVAVEPLRGLVEVVLQVARLVGLGNQRQQFHHRRVQARCRESR